MFSDTITKIAPALLKAQKEMGNSVKGSSNPFFKSRYADLNSVREAVTPALHANGIVILQLNQHLNGKNFVVTTLLHESGEFITSETEVVSKDASNPQALGSAISYARRYGLQSMLSIGADDDDGETAVGRATTKSNGKTQQTLPGPVTISPANQSGASFGSFRQGNK
jgi:hypothetical protein